MANICENRVWATGEVAQVQKFLSEYFDEYGFTVEKKHPSTDVEGPEEYTRKWGTRWCNPTSSVVQRSKLGKHSAVFWVDTPWGPPRDMFERISSEYPGVRFSLRYLEPDMGEMGVFQAVDGKVLRDE